MYYLREPVGVVGAGSSVWVDDNYAGAKVIEMRRILGMLYYTYVILLPL